MSDDPNASGLADVERLVAEAEEADALLRSVVEVLAARTGAGCGIRFVEEGAWTLGPWGGATGPIAADVAVRYDDEIVAELVSTTALDEATRAAWERVADLLAPYCLVGWDTGGETWDP
jgi:hypothetical protein